MHAKFEELRALNLTKSEVIAKMEEFAKENNFFLGKPRRSEESMESESVSQDDSNETLAEGAQQGEQQQHEERRGGRHGKRGQRGGRRQGRPQQLQRDE